MMTETRPATHIAICCITFRRPLGLTRLLDGLNGQEFTKSRQPKITVIVVDNDESAPMAAMVEARREQFRWDIVYACEPRRGLAYARNRSIELVPQNADFLAFIDDDEVPVVDWLDQMIAIGAASNAALVMGPVKPRFEGDPPAWIVQGRFFETGPYVDGARLHYGYTSNALVSAELFRQEKLRFDHRFNVTGGEDQHLFSRALAGGAEIVTSANGLVVEWIPQSRQTLGYLLKRRFRMGTTLAMVDRIEGNRFWLPIRMLKACARMGIGLCQCVLRLPEGKAGLAKAVLNIAWGCGSLAGVFGLRYREYAGPPG